MGKCGGKRKSFKILVRLLFVGFISEKNMIIESISLCLVAKKVMENEKKYKGIS